MAPDRVRRSLHRAARLATAVAIAAALLAAAPGARAQDVSEPARTAPSIAEKAFDAVVLRPLHGAALLLGGAFFALSLPLVAPMQGIRTSWDVFVYAPYEYTVLRDLGDF